MTKSGNLWAIGYDDMGRANQVRDEIISLGWHKHYLILDDVAVVVRHPDGSFTLNREAFPAASNVLGCSVVGFLAGLVLGGAGLAAAKLVKVGLLAKFSKVIIAALIVWLLNWMYRMSIESNRDREREEEARRYFDRHGRWPDE